jgi:hypothetical protein
MPVPFWSRSPWLNLCFQFWLMLKPNPPRRDRHCSPNQQQHPVALYAHMQSKNYAQSFKPIDPN